VDGAAPLGENPRVDKRLYFGFDGRVPAHAEFFEEREAPSLRGLVAD
jgi:hypothetical protein